MSKMSLRTFIQKYNNGDFKSSDVDTQIEAGWFDWFCEDWNLAENLQPLADSLRMIQTSPKIDLDNMYVYFKNCSTISEKLYDRIGINTMDGEGVFCIEYGDERQKALWVVYDMKKLETGGSNVYAGDLAGMVEWFLKG